MIRDRKQNSGAGNLVENQLYRLFAPIIVWPGCEDLVTDEMKERLRISRLSEPLAKTATDYECMVYLHTASLAAMPSDRWCRIYEHLFSQAYPEQAKKIGVYRNGLNDVEKRELMRLRDWIYEQQMKGIREKRAES